MMAALYDVALPTINEHIKKIYADDELSEGATIRNFRIVQTEGSRQVSREIAHYNLQMIIAVGFKVNNERAVRFRKWAGQIVKDYTIQGWVMDKERLKKATCSQMNTLNASLNRFAKSGFRSASFSRRLLTCIPRLLITIKMLSQQKNSSKWYRIKCIMQFTATLRLN